MNLANVWRPKTLDDVLGQQHIVATLTRHLHEKCRAVYLFAGSAGVGKTTVARIVGDMLNAEVIEIDAASNNGVDAFREISEVAQYNSITHSSKLFIIDECHMLSKSAWNASLKLFEEADRTGSRFILCTTEAEKVPLTIQSRSFRFDFRPIQNHIVMERLKHIAETEGATYELEALEIIAENSNGGMRDGIRLLDSVLPNVTVEAIQDKLGLVSKEDISILLDDIEAGDTESVGGIIDFLNHSGTCFETLTAQLIGVLMDRGLLKYLDDILKVHSQMKYERFRYLVFKAMCMKWASQ